MSYLKLNTLIVILFYCLERALKNNLKKIKGNFYIVGNYRNNFLKKNLT